MRPGRKVGVRARVALVAALAVAVAVMSSSAVVFFVVRHDLIGRVDTALEHRAELLAKRREKRGVLAAIEPTHRGPAALPAAPLLAQVVAATGAVVAREEAALRLPVSAAVRQVAEGRRSPYFAGATVGRTPVRMLVTGFGAGRALEVVQPVAELDVELERLAAVLVVTAASGVLLALLLGAGVAGVALRPVRRMTAAAEHLAATRDLAEAIPVDGHDELSRLAGSINTVLEALHHSQRAQRQLVADASHELRTPLTSLRTNVEVLASESHLEPATRRLLVSDLAAQLDALSGLVGDLIELARLEDTVVASTAADVLSLDEQVGRAVAQAERNHPGVRFEQDLSPVLVRGAAPDLERVVANLLDNAAKWSAEGGVVEVVLRDADDVASAAAVGARGTALAGEHPAGCAVLFVRDHGPGIAPGDLPHVFDRFYRGTGARRVPGSGLGLAIVRRIVEAHGGTVVAEASRGGGTRVVVRLPCLEEEEE